jgi:hypothetical protein
MAPKHMSNAVWAAIITAVLSLLISGYETYSHNDRVLAQDVAGLKAHREDDETRLDRIQQQVDKLVNVLIDGKQP